ncbi:hypervirulence associated TUDOR domain-containing protein [Streptomyces rishiriensis]|uniref:Hypervirulence associated protein TUDOR domain-containing protein n=1 Tax=Streptomyces rishiriensis TaxID=68264 RepID=A0ABU0P1L3_STRRH|nr:DUF2945 domain-containing protein [Streptomyces rishiriensis]MDQ0585224.1 hypothetical protein [Streptomyces rishiriensis]
MAKQDDPGKGDKVSWKSHGKNVTGKVKKKITERTEAAGRTVDASSEEPQYEVESDKTGRSAVHKPGALRKKGGRS